tara:strand:- start:822 stop:1478 length:657 start_codon:yes stop_codon:yes gene_type:complete
MCEIINELLKNYLINLLIYDNVLCICLGTRGRWYQLHCLINFLITINILPSIIEIITDPINGYKLIENNNHNNMVISLHIYHLLAFKNLNYIDYLHHLIFVGLGVIPGMLYINSNQLYLHKIACSGIPGIIEYGTLTLYKNNRLSKRNQKYINTLLYVFIRLPMCIFGTTINFFAYREGLIKDPLWITIYVNLLLYLNGSVFTFLTADSYFRVKYLEN